MKKGISIFIGFMLLVLLFAFQTNQATAAETQKNVHVTIPTQLQISFNDDGTTNCSDFVVENHSLVPITLHTVCVTEHNGWKLVDAGNQIGVNQKKMVLIQENQILYAGSNTMGITIPENNIYQIQYQAKQGAWTVSSKAEKALELEFEYTIGKKSFELNLEEHKKIMAYNGESVVLPLLSKYGYEFRGWKDVDGKIYTDSYVMPIGNTTLKPQWVKTTPRAVYSATDNSLTFYNNADTMKVGDTYNGKKVTAIYTGMENNYYTAGVEVPWYPYRSEIKKVHVQDEIRPQYLSYWFYMFQYCSDINVEKINPSQTTKMNFLFYGVGQYCSNVKIVGLNKWDTSKVTTMNSMFDYVGYESGISISLGDLSAWNVSKVTDMFCMFRFIGWKKCTSFQLGDLSKWDVSNVTTMMCTFASTAPYAKWSQDLSNWNVSKVTEHEMFSNHVESKIKSPKWVY